MPNEDIVICRPTEAEFKKFQNFVHEVYVTNSYNCGAVKVIPPQEQLSNYNPVSHDLLEGSTPLLQAYEKKAEGVYKCLNLEKKTPVTMPNFTARNVKASLAKSGFCTYNNDHTFCDSMLRLYEDVLESKQFSEYVVDVNGTLFPDLKHPW